MSLWSAALKASQQHLKTWVDNRIAMLFGYTTMSRSSALGDQDQVATSDDSGEQRPSRRLEPWGHAGRAPAKVRSFWIRLGSSALVTIGFARPKGYGPDDLQDGEMCLYCSAKGTRVLLDKDGNVKIDCASGKDVIVNGGTSNVNIDGDPVAITSDFLTWIQGLATAASYVTPLPSNYIGNTNSTITDFKAG